MRNYAVVNVNADGLPEALRELTDTVQGMIQKDGWEPCGGVSVVQGTKTDADMPTVPYIQYYCCQALTRD